MWGWLVQNKQWVFDGSGIAALGVLWWLVKKFWLNGEVQAAPITTIQAPSIAPIITNTINFPAAAPTPTPEPPKILNPPIPAAPKPQPNLRLETTKTGKISLEGDIWTLRPHRDQEQYRGLLADISNVPTDDTRTSRAAIRAAIRMEINGKPRTYAPLPWLEEFTNLIYLETGATKTVVLAVGRIARMGVWTFVLNHRKDYGSSGAVTQMDWTNQCPIPSDLPFEIVMIDMNNGSTLAKFVYVWAFDVDLNWPILKPVD